MDAMADHPDEDKAARERDAVILKMASQPHISLDQLRAKLRAEKAQKKGRGPKSAPRSK